MRNAKLLLLRHGKPLINVPVKDVTPDLIQAAPAELWAKHPLQARRALGMIERCWTGLRASQALTNFHVVWCSVRGEARCRMSVISLRIYTSTSSALAAIRSRALVTNIDYG